MLETIYHDTIMAGWVTATILGICLLAGRVPNQETYRDYIRSKKILGIAYILFGISISQFYFFNLRETSQVVAVALPLSYYYLEGILFGMSFSSLLDKEYISRKQICRDFGLYAGFLILVWGGALFTEGTPRMVMLVAGAAWFFLAAAGISLRFLRIYKVSVAKINDYYADNVAMFVKWLHKSTYGIIVCGLSGSVLAFAPQCGNAVFMLVGIIMFTYIFISFQNYILNHTNVETAVEADTTVSVNENTATEEALQSRIERWIEEGKHLTPGVTLGDLTIFATSNRTYVSAHINKRYGCNFREWINSLRMEYAKKQLREYPDMTIEKIARNAGFSSSAYFCHQFAKREGMTPTTWREKARTR